MLVLFVNISFSECPNYDIILPVLLKKGIKQLPEHCKITPGIPLKPMLAQPTKGVQDVLQRFDKLKFTCEWKYDGERAQVLLYTIFSSSKHCECNVTLFICLIKCFVFGRFVTFSSGYFKLQNLHFDFRGILCKMCMFQIHVNENNDVTIYSRNQENNTGKYPDIIMRLNNCKTESVKSCILDCEAVAWDVNKKQILPFQVLSTRKRKVRFYVTSSQHRCIFVTFRTPIRRT